jgi:predicted transcriptional regulator
MLVCVRTTLNLDDELMRLVKQRARATGRTITQVIEEALREGLSGTRPQASQPFELRWVTVRGRLLPGVDLDDRDSLYERMDGR